MREKKSRRWLSLLLTAVMLLSLIPGAAIASAEGSEDDFYKIVHVDAGRKYFSPDNIKTIIDEAAAAGFNQVELYLSDNQGFRFALDDMTVTTSYGAYDLTPALGDGYSQLDSSPQKIPDGSGKYLTQSEMTDIISHAAGKGIDIVPCINVPGHMGAILEEFTSFRYTNGSQTSKSSIDLANEEAVAFALAITQKYVDYFKTQGVKYYNIGADEYANDLSSMGFEGMGSTLYTKFVEFLNSAADIIIAAGMTPRAFNDGFLYTNYDVSVTPNTAYQICYWTSGWIGYDVASAATLDAKGYKLINTDGSYYWILGATQCDAEKASGFNYTTFSGNSTISDPAGAMFCIWCDVGDTDGTDDGTAVVSATADVIAAFGAALPASETGGDGGDTGNTGDVAVTESKTITVTAGQSITDTINGADYSNNVVETELDKSIATVSAEYEQVPGGTKEEKATSITSGSAYYIKNSSGQYLSSSATWVSDISSAALWIVTSSGNGYTLTNGNNYLRYQNGSLSTTTKSKNATSWTFSNGTFSCTQNSGGPGGGSSTTYTLGDAYTVTTTDPVDATTVTFTGVTVGTTYVTVGNTRYTINVVAEDLSTVTPLTVEFWMTNSEVTGTSEGVGNGVTSYGIPASAANVYSEGGASVSDFVPMVGLSGSSPNFDAVYWQTRVLAYDSTDSGHTNCYQHQTNAENCDHTADGTAVEYIRYWQGSWWYSDGDDWTQFADDDQLVAYYLLESDLASEVTVYSKDWGFHSGEYWGYADYYVTPAFVTVEVVYPNGDTKPVDLADSTWIFGYSSGKKIGYYEIAPVLDLDGVSYEVYKVTDTPGNGAANKTVGGNNTVFTITSLAFTGTETTLQEADEGENLGDRIVVDSNDTTLVTLEFNADYNARRIRIYVREKPNENSLIIRYVDRSTGTQIYEISVTAKTGESFNGFSYNDGTISPTYITKPNGTQYTIQTDLKSLPEISNKYSNATYELVGADVSEDDTVLTLYYNIDANKTFVYDFALPMAITPSDMGVSNAISVSVQGQAITASGTNVTFVPSSAATNGYQSSITYTYSDGSSTTHLVNFTPASNVLYEDGFMTAGTSWTGDGSKGNDTTNATQSSKNEAPYGYDAAYVSETGASGTQYVATVSSSDTRTDDLTFTFTGTGFDLIGACGPATGTLLVRVEKANGDYVIGYLVDTSFTDDLDNDNVNDKIYQVPLVHAQDWAEDTYTVTIRGAYINYNANTVSPAAYSLNAETSTVSAGVDPVSAIYDLFDSMGFTDEEIDSVEFINMDKLYGGATYAVENNDAGVSTFALAGTPSSMTLEIDGFRVYRSTANSAYCDAEQGVQYVNVLDAVQEKGFAAYTETNADFTATTRAEYESKGGPQNEIYLTAGKSVVLNTSLTEGDTVQISARAVSGTTYLNGMQLTSNTEMYYAVVVGADGTITVGNTGGSEDSGLLALGNLKIKAASPEAVSLLFEDVTDETLEVATFMLRSYAAAPEEPETDPVFTPEILDIKVKSTNVIRNKLITVTITASTDVAKLTVNGKEVRPTNSLMVKLGWSKTYTYVIVDTVKKTDTKDYEVITYDANGVSSEVYTAQG